MDNKTCVECEISKPVDQFGKNKYCKDGLASWCKDCTRKCLQDWRAIPVNKQKQAERRKWREENVPGVKEARKERSKKDWDKMVGYKKGDALLRRYGISLEDFEKMKKEQDGKCAICGSPPGKRDLAVDHDHKTGKVRALLCNGRCNRGLGLFRDDIEYLKSAILYLEKHSSLR